MTNDKGPATQSETEALAIGAVQSFLDACRLTHHDQVADRLMKLCSVAGVVMAQAEGSAGAAARLISTGEFILNKMPAKAAKPGVLQ